MQRFPADPSDVGAAIAVDAMLDAADAAKLLGIDVQQLARSTHLVAAHLARRLEPGQALQPMPSHEMNHVDRATPVSLGDPRVLTNYS